MRAAFGLRGEQVILGSKVKNWPSTTIAAALTGWLASGCSILFEPPSAGEECAVAAGAIFADGFEDGTLGAFDESGEIMVVSEPARCGAYAARVDGAAAGEDTQGAGGEVEVDVSTLNELHLRAYVRLDAGAPLPDGSAIRLFGLSDLGAANGYILVRARGGAPSPGLEVYVGNQDRVLASSSNFLTEGGWHRVDLLLRADPDLVEIQVDHRGVLSAAAPDLDLGAGGFARLRAGILSNGAPTPVTVYLDEIAIDDAPIP